MTGYTINLNSTTGGHGLNDPHTQGRAGDINTINGIRVSDIRVYPLVQNLMRAIEKVGGVNQVIGPDRGLSGNFVHGELDRNRPISPGLLLEHLNHIHVNVPYRNDDDKY